MNSIASIKKNKKITINNKLKTYLDPDYVYLPIINNADINAKNHDAIYKDSIILQSENIFSYSPISGTIIGATKVRNIKNEEIRAIVIENDFKEKTKKRTGTKKNITSYSKEEVINLIKTFNITHKNIKGKILIINGIDLDPFEENYSFIIKKYADKLLECIDALYEIFKIKKCFFAIKNNDSENVDMLINNIGTYPGINLKLMQDVYPLGEEGVLTNKLVSEKLAKNGVIHFNVEEILNIYEVLKRNKPLSEKIITISGDAVENPIILNAKLGVLIKDIIENYVKKTADNYLLIINGLLQGHEVSENTILTNEIRSIFLIKKIDCQEKECINCGLCYQNCPVKVNPKYMHEYKNKKSKDYRKKCINCGLCTYICPSKINLTKE